MHYSTITEVVYQILSNSIINKISGHRKNRSPSRFDYSIHYWGRRKMGNQKAAGCISGAATSVIHAVRQSIPCLAMTFSLPSYPSLTSAPSYSFCPSHSLCPEAKMAAT
jgi:hypothetical protein